MSIRRYNKTVEAMQYDGTIHSAGAIMEWTDYRARASSGKLIIDGQVIDENDWVVHWQKGIYWVVNSVTFTAEYSPAQ